MALFQAIAIGLIALILTPGQLFYFDVTPKVAVLLAGTAVLLVWQAWRPSPPPRWFTLVILFNMVSLTVSTALSRNVALSLFGSNWRRFGAVEQAAVLLFAWLIAGREAGEPRAVRTVLRGIAISGIAAAAYGIAQYFGWDPFLPRAAYHTGEGIWTIVRPPGTLGYSSYFATWLVLTVFLSLTLAAMETAVAWRRVAQASAALSLGAMLLTGTRAAMLGFVAGAAVWLWIGGLRQARRLLAGLALVSIAGAAFYISPAGRQLRSRARWFAEDARGGGRAMLWRDSLSMAARRLPAGWGPEVFTAAFPAFETSRLTRQYPDFSYQSPHNMFLDSLTAQGIPGLLGVGALLWIGFRAARRSPTLAAALTAGVVSQQFTVLTMPTALLLFTAAAIAVAQDRTFTGQPPGPYRSTARSRSRLRSEPRASGSSVALCVAAAFPAILFMVVAVRLTAADRALELARRYLDAGRVADAAASFAQYDGLRLPGTAADLWYSRACFHAAEAARDPVVRVQAMAQYGAAALRATATAEEPFDAWYNASQFYAVRNDAAGVERSLRAAIAARPNWFKPHWALAQLLLLESRLADADREAWLAAQLDGGADPEVMATWKEIHAQRVKSATPPLHK